MAGYLCICLLDWEPGDFQKIHLCTGHSRSQPCYRCTSGILPLGGCNSQPRWDRCCHCTGTGGKASRGRYSPEGLRSSRHHRAHISYLRVRQSDVTRERPEMFLVPLVTDSLEQSPGTMLPGPWTWHQPRREEDLGCSSGGVPGHWGDLGHISISSERQHQFASFSSF